MSNNIDTEVDQEPLVFYDTPIRELTETYNEIEEQNRMYGDRYPITIIHSPIREEIKMLAQENKTQEFLTLLREKLRTPLKRCRALRIFQSVYKKGPDSFALLKLAADQLDHSKKCPFTNALLECEVANIKISHGMALCERNHHFGAAVKLYEEGIELLKGLPVNITQSDLFLVNAHSNAALAYSQLGNRDKAIQHHQAALQILQDNPSLDAYSITSVALASSRLFEWLGETKEAIKISQWVLTAYEQTEKTAAVDKIPDLQGLPLLLHKLRASNPTLYQKLRFENVKSLVAALLSAGRPEEATKLDDLVTKLYAKAPADEKLHSDGELNFAWGKYYATSYQTAVDCRKSIDTTLENKSDNTQIIQLKNPAFEYLGQAFAAYDRAGLYYHRAEVELIQSELELTVAETENIKIKPNYKEKLFGSLNTVEQHLGVPLYSLFNIGSKSECHPSQLETAKRIIEKLYPTDNAQKSYCKFLRDYYRYRTRELNKAINLHLPNTDAETPTLEQITRAGQAAFGFEQIQVFDGTEGKDLEFSQLTGLHTELIRSAQEQNWPVANYQDALKHLHDTGGILALKHFYSSETLADLAHETTLLTYSGSKLLLITCDPNRYAAYNFEEQIAIKNLLNSLSGQTAVDVKSKLTDMLRQAQTGDCPIGEDESQFVEKMVIETFLETVGAEIVTKNGEFVYVCKPEPITYGGQQTNEPLAAAIVSSLRDSETTLMEQYAGKPADKLFTDHAKSLAEAGIITDTNRTFTRDQIGSAGSFGIAREVRSHPLARALIFRKIAEQTLKNENEFIFPTMSGPARKILHELNIPYCSLLPIDDAALERAGYTLEKKQEWGKYMGLDTEVIAFRADVMFERSNAKVEEILASVN